MTGINTTNLPLDTKGHPIPVLALKPGTAQKITSGAASARNATAFQSDTQVVTLYATEDMYIEFGDATVTASNTTHFFKKDRYRDFAVNDRNDMKFTHVAVLQVSNAGVLHISERT